MSKKKQKETAADARRHYENAFKHAYNDAMSISIEGTVDRTKFRKKYDKEHASELNHINQLEQNEAKKAKEEAEKNKAEKAKPKAQSTKKDAQQQAEKQRQKQKQIEQQIAEKEKEAQDIQAQADDLRRNADEAKERQKKAEEKAEKAKQERENKLASNSSASEAGYGPTQTDNEDDGYNNNSDDHQPPKLQDKSKYTTPDELKDDDMSVVITTESKAQGKTTVLKKIPSSLIAKMRTLSYAANLEYNNQTDMLVATVLALLPTVQRQDLYRADNHSNIKPILFNVADRINRQNQAVSAEQLEQQQKQHKADVKRLKDLQVKMEELLLLVMTHFGTSQLGFDLNATAGKMGSLEDLKQIKYNDPHLEELDNVTKKAAQKQLQDEERRKGSNFPM